MKDVSQDTLFSLCKGYDNAKQYLIESVKISLYGLDKNIFDKLDFYDDSIFLDPLFFASINDTDNRIKDILIGCYSPDIDFNFVTDGLGKVYFPKYGMFYLETKNQKVTVCKKNNQFVFKDVNGNKLNYKNIPIRKSLYDIEFFEYSYPFITKLMMNSNIVEGSKYEKYFNKALEIIKTVMPEFFVLIVQSVKKVIFIKGTDNSFATLKTHGIIYLNIKDEYNEVFFVDDIVHQSAHVIYNTLTLQTKSKFFTESYNQYRKSANDESAEDFYSRFHGLYTMCLITKCLTSCLKINLFEGEKKIELIGRIADNMSKFRRLIHDLVHPKYFEEEAIKWFSIFKITYDSMEKENSEIIKRYNISNQPYVFDLAVFKATNSLK